MPLFTRDIFQQQSNPLPPNPLAVFTIDAQVNTPVLAFTCNFLDVITYYISGSVNLGLLVDPPRGRSGFAGQTPPNEIFSTGESGGFWPYVGNSEYANARTYFDRIVEWCLGYSFVTSGNEPPANLRTDGFRPTSTPYKTVAVTPTNVIGDQLDCYFQFNALDQGSPDGAVGKFTIHVYANLPPTISDHDVAAWNKNVNALGGVNTLADLERVDIFVKALKGDGVWDSIRTLWIGVGTWPGCAAYLKWDASEPSALDVTGYTADAFAQFAGITGIPGVPMETGVNIPSLNQNSFSMGVDIQGLGSGPIPPIDVFQPLLHSSYPATGNTDRCYIDLHYTLLDIELATGIGAFFSNDELGIDGFNFITYDNIDVRLFQNGNVPVSITPETGLVWQKPGTLRLLGLNDATSGIFVVGSGFTVEHVNSLAWRLFALKNYLGRTDI